MMRDARGPDLEGMLAMQLRAAGLPEPVREYRPLPPRRWRLDFAWPDRKLGLEVQGGLWVRGRHSRPRGQERDMEKHNALVLAGWRVLLVPGSAICDRGEWRTEALRLVEQALGEEEG